MKTKIISITLILRKNGMHISNDKIVRGNTFIARFHGLYYRNDWQEKFPKGYCVKLKSFELSQDFLKDKDLLHFGNRFMYHESWSQLLEYWFCFQEVWKGGAFNEELTDSEYWKEFTLGVSKENKLIAWKGLAKGAYYFFDKYWNERRGMVIRCIDNRQKNK
jgi:hypothetical protein